MHGYRFEECLLLLLKFLDQPTLGGAFTGRQVRPIARQYFLGSFELLRYRCQLLMGHVV